MSRWVNLQKMVGTRAKVEIWDTPASNVTNLPRVLDCKGFSSVVLKNVIRNAQPVSKCKIRRGVASSLKIAKWMGLRLEWMVLGTLYSSSEWGGRAVSVSPNTNGGETSSKVKEDHLRQNTLLHPEKQYSPFFRPSRLADADPPPLRHLPDSNVLQCSNPRYCPMTVWKPTKSQQMTYFKKKNPPPRWCNENATSSAAKVLITLEPHLTPKPLIRPQPIQTPKPPLQVLWGILVQPPDYWWIEVSSGLLNTKKSDLFNIFIQKWCTLIKVLILLTGCYFHKFCWVRQSFDRYE